MAFKYDFDMFSRVPDDMRCEFKGIWKEAGKGGNAGGQTALFRDPVLAAVLSTADAAVKQIFLDSGFGFSACDSGAPDGRYPEQDEEARNACVRRLADNIAKADGLDHADWAGFDLDEFLTYLTEARPIDAADMQAAALSASGGGTGPHRMRPILVCAGVLIAGTIALGVV